MRIITLALSVLALSCACGGVEAPVPVLPEPVGSERLPPAPVPEAPTTFRERLAAGIDLQLSTEGSGFSLAVQDGTQPATPARPLALLGGGAHLALDASGQLSLSGLEVALDEVVVGPEVFPPNGLHVVDIRAGLELAQIDASMSEDATLTNFTGEARLWVSWALLDRLGHKVPLRPLDVRAEVGGTLKGSMTEAVELEILGASPGTVLLVADRFGLSDLSFSLQLSE